MISFPIPVVLSVNLLAAISGAVVSLLFSYIPKLNVWFAKQSSLAKALIMVLVLAVISGVLYAGACLKLFSGIGCDKASAWKLVEVFINAVIANQGIYLLSPTTKAVKAAKV